MIGPGGGDRGASGGAGARAGVAADRAAAGASKAAADAQKKNGPPVGKVARDAMRRGRTRGQHAWLRREMPFDAHHAHKVHTDDIPFHRVMPGLSAEHPRLGDADGLCEDRSLMFVVDVDAHRLPTTFSVNDLDGISTN
jgi:hypothetical protein